MAVSASRVLVRRRNVFSPPISLPLRPPDQHAVGPVSKTRAVILSTQRLREICVLRGIVMLTDQRTQLNSGIDGKAADRKPIELFFGTDLRRKKTGRECVSF